MSHDDKDSPLTTWLRRQGASALERDAADRIDQLMGKKPEFRFAFIQEQTRDKGEEFLKDLDV